MINIDEKFQEKFNCINNEYDELLELVSSVEIMSDHKLLKFYQSKLKKIEQVAQKIKQLKKFDEDFAVLMELKSQGEDGLSFELENLEKNKNDLVNEIKEILASQKEMSQEKVLIEITSKEDVEFCDVLFGLFESFSKIKNYEFEIVCKNAGEIKISISGEGVFDQFKIFSGKNKRVVRGVESVCLVVVLKESNEDIVIDEKDLIIQTSKSSGAGGQHINKTESAVKITHIPTGIFAECQDERSQTKNKEKAMDALLKKISQMQNEKAKKLEKNQRNDLKTKIFASTPAIVFDYDANKVFVNESKTEYKLKDILSGELGLIINNRV